MLLVTFSICYLCLSSFVAADQIERVNNREDEVVGSILAELCEMTTFKHTRMTSIAARCQEASIKDMKGFLDLDNNLWAKDYTDLE